jgi:hypothetical protein
MDHRIYLVIYNHPEQGLMGVHADASSPSASEVAWALLQNEDMLAYEVTDNGLANEPEHGLRQICLGLDDAYPVSPGVTGTRLVELDATDCPHPTWMSLHPAFDFEALSHGETPPYIKRWLAFEPWDE